MNFVFIAAVIVLVTFIGIYSECVREIKTNEGVLAIRESFLKGCLVSLVLILLPILGSIAFPKLQPRLATITFIVELAAIAVFGFRELRRLFYRRTKLACLLALLVGVALVWWQLFSYYKIEQTIFSNMDFVFVPLMTWLATITVVVYTYLEGPKLRPKKLSKTEAENAKLREQIERLQKQLLVDNKKQSGTPEPSVTEDKKAEQNLPKNTQTDKESATQVEEAQTTASAPKSDAEDKPKKVTNPSMNEIQQQTLSEILDMLNSDSSPEDQFIAIDELINSYRTATIQEAATQKEKALSQGPKPTDPKVDSKKEPEETEEEEEILDPVDYGDDWEDDTIFPDLFTANNLVRAAFAVAIIFVVCVGIRVFA